MEETPILFYDGVCGLCNRLVYFVLRNDRKGAIRVAALQSDVATEKLKGTVVNVNDPDTILFLEKGVVYSESDAVARILSCMGGGWQILSVFRILPRFIRDGVYRFVARNRYRWFGRYDACPMPRPEWKDRFIG